MSKNTHPTAPDWCAWVLERNRGALPTAWMRIEVVYPDTVLPGAEVVGKLVGTPDTVGPWIFQKRRALVFLAGLSSVSVCVCFDTIRRNNARNAAVITGPGGACWFAAGPIYLWLSDWRQFGAVSEIMDNRGVLIFEEGPLIQLSDVAERLAGYDGVDHA